MASEPALIEFASARAMAERLADLAALSLSRSIAAQGLATIAVSGGSTPTPLYEALSRRAIDWSNVAATLVDERWVPPTDIASNEAMARRSLLQGPAAAARFVGFWSEAPGLDAGAREASARLASVVRPFDVVILGMGADGHAASWFPHADGLADALRLDGPPIAPVTARASRETLGRLERLTLTLGAIASARLILLVITGEEKRKAYEAACADGPVEDMPVRAILRARADLWACWAPAGS